MYGMVNQAVRGLIIEKFGTDVWTQIHTSAQAPAQFSVMEPYDDDITYRLVTQASATLNLPPETVLHVFGQYWVLNVATHHYASLMSSSGTDFVDFLHNLDHMHHRIRVIFPEYRPPSFRVKVLKPELLQLDYYSSRQGLLPFVTGLITGLAQHFKVSVSFEFIEDSQHKMPCKRILVHHGPLD